MHIQESVSLAPYHTFGVQVRTRYLVDIDSLATLQAALAEPCFAGLPRLILGGGSNLLPTQDFPGVVFRLTMRGRRVVREAGDEVWVEAAAGETWHDFVQWTLDQGWGGLENLSLIPGTVGAAPIQNIGAYGVELKDCFDALEAYDLQTGTVQRLDREACRFGYRDSLFKQAWRDRAVILSVTVKLSRKAVVHTAYAELARELAASNIESPTPRQVADAVIRVRQRKLPDPAEIGNAGSFFKNPVVPASQADELAQRFPDVVRYPAGEGRTKLAAGWLIDQAGWKGKSVGRAGVYEKQALVLVNRGGATGEEVWALAQAIQTSVHEKFGVTLEPEPVIL